MRVSLKGGAGATEDAARAMIFITKTPFRISFFGGGTDYPSWYLREGGAVLSTSVDKYCYITCRAFPPFFPDAYRIVWSHIENVSSIAEILHPAVREGLLMMGFAKERGVEIHHQGDLPARSGMGSSSAFANGLLLALSAMQGAPLDKVSLYRRAIELEQERLKDHVGSQDQVATAVGGFNVIRFATDGTIEVEPIGAAPERLAALNDRLMLLFTGTSRLGDRIAAEVIAGLFDKAAALRRMHAMVDEAAALLRGDGDLDEFGRLLHESWLLKRSLSPAISTSTIDEIYEVAQRHGALGGKLLGAGGSGFMLFYVPLERQPAVRNALGRLLQVPFGFDTKGARLIQNGEGDDERNAPEPVNRNLRRILAGAFSEAAE